MADTKITALTAITTVDPAVDVLPIVDVSDTTMAASGTTKKITSNQILGAGGTATLASATITGALTVGTGANAAVLKASFLGGYSVFENSAGTGNPSITFNNDLDTGIRAPSANTLVFDAGGFEQYRIASSGVFTWSDGAGGTRMTLNSTGLGVGDSPSYKLHVARTADGTVGYFRRIGATINPALTVYCNETGNTVGFGTDYAGAASPAITFTTAGTERLRIDSSGNVGIGVTPSAWSQGKAIETGFLGNALWGAAQAQVIVSKNAYFNAGWKYAYTGATASNYEQGSGGHLWYTAPSGTAGNAITFTQAMTLDASGNLLVGTTTNTDVYRTNIQFSGTSVNGLIVKNLASTGGPVLLYLHDSAQSLNTASPSAEYQDSTTQRWRLYKNGGLANYQANNVNLSDVRTKTDIKPLGSYWNKIKSLEVVTFKYKDQTHSDDNIGLIAQQVESVAPELVDADGFGNTPEDGVPLKTIYTTDLYHAAIKALQEAMARIEVLESKLA